MKLFKTISSNTIFALQVLLLFLLIFENQIQLPTLLQVGGRLHPLILHLPIGLILTLGFFPFLKKHIEKSSLDQMRSFLLHLAGLTAVVTALAGLFLAQENGYQGAILFNHKWFGVAVSLFTYGLLIIDKYFSSYQNIWLVALYSNIILVILAGHFGGNLTHGENFVLEPFQRQKNVSKEEKTLYKAVIEPIFKSKCIGCHNGRKTKGELLMASLDDILKGGKHGASLLLFDASNSLMMQRIYLPLDEKEHMPPKGKSQLSDEEINILTIWIDEGANENLRLDEVSDTSGLYEYVQKILSSKTTKTYHFNAASKAKLDRLNTPLRSVQPISIHSPALSASIFIRKFYKPKLLKELKTVQMQLVQLNLTNLPITDKDLTFIAQFPNLEKVILNGTDVLGENLGVLSSCKKLEKLALVNTDLSKKAIAELNQLSSLKKVYLWQSGLSEEDFQTVEQNNLNLTIERGYIPDENEMIAISPPDFRNKNSIVEHDEKIELFSRFSGVEIRYTLDGSEPDSINSLIYSAPITISEGTTITAKTYLEGWKSSETVAFTFFKKGITPVASKILTTPNANKRGKMEESLFDGRKGRAKNYSGVNWLGFRKENFMLQFDLGEEPRAIEYITLSCLRDQNTWIFPPEEMKLYGSNDTSSFELLEALHLELTDSLPVDLVVPINVPVKEQYRYYKLEAQPVQKMPKWHPGAGSLAHMFLDEIFLIERKD